MKISSVFRLLLIFTLVAVMGCSTGRSSKYVYKPSYQRTREQQKSYLLGKREEDSKNADVTAKADKIEEPEQKKAEPPEKSEKKGWWPWSGKKAEKPEEEKQVVTEKSGFSDRVIYKLKPGDQVIVSLRGIPKEEQIEDIIDENGFIAFAYINSVHAAGLTASELEHEIKNAYLDAKIYKNISVNVLVPAQSYFVRGEVKQPGRYPILSGVTLVQAIAAAGGYTEFANSKKVQMIRGNRRIIKNVRDLEKRPENDVAVEAGDVIVVPRSVF
ncbi:MAG: polysaccharide export protein [Verrucomicrobia bacterium]|nr:polysaccharide export protein [Verrucomicrobiota bacterium]